MKRSIFTFNIIFVLSIGFSQNNPINETESYELDCAKCPKLVSRTKYRPKPRRNTIGIGEELTVTLKNSKKCGSVIDWNVSKGMATIVSKSGEEAGIEMSKTPGLVTIEATVSGGPSCSQSCNVTVSIDFDVIAPTGVYSEIASTYQSCPNTKFHTEDVPSAGMVLTQYLQPDNVNFYNIEIQEGFVPPNPSGPYYTNLPSNLSLPNHPLQPSNQMTNTVRSGKGTKVGLNDEVYMLGWCDITTSSTNKRDAMLSGDFSYDIPQYYLDDAGVRQEFARMLQMGQNFGGVNSLYTTSKTDVNQVNTSFNLTDPTTPCAWSPNCP